MKLEIEHNVECYLCRALNRICFTVEKWPHRTEWTCACGHHNKINYWPADDLPPEDAPGNTKCPYAQTLS